MSQATASLLTPVVSGSLSPRQLPKVTDQSSVSVQVAPRLKDSVDLPSLTRGIMKSHAEKLAERATEASEFGLELPALNGKFVSSAVNSVFRMALAVPIVGTPGLARMAAEVVFSDSSGLFKELGAVIGSFSNLDLNSPTTLAADLQGLMESSGVLKKAIAYALDCGGMNLSGVKGGLIFEKWVSAQETALKDLEAAQQLENAKCKGSSIEIEDISSAVSSCGSCANTVKCSSTVSGKEPKPDHKSYK